MINTIKNMLGLGPKVDYAELVKQGAVIIDVRTKGEYAGDSRIRNSDNRRNGNNSNGGYYGRNRYKLSPTRYVSSAIASVRSVKSIMGG